MLNVQLAMAVVVLDQCRLMLAVEWNYWPWTLGFSLFDCHPLLLWLTVWHHVTTSATSWLDWLSNVWCPSTTDCWSAATSPPTDSLTTDWLSDALCSSPECWSTALTSVMTACVLHPCVCLMGCLFFLCSVNVMSCKYSIWCAPKTESPSVSSIGTRYVCFLAYVL